MNYNKKRQQERKKKTQRHTKIISIMKKISTK